MFLALAAIGVLFTSPSAAAPVAEPGPAGISVPPGYKFEKAGINAYGFIRNDLWDRCLTNDASDRSRVYLAPCHWGASQQWQWNERGGGNWPELFNKATYFCLDGNGSTGLVYGHGCNGGEYQGWRYDSGNWTIYHQQSRGGRGVLDAAPERVYIGTEDGGQTQDWL
ncbi:hypothetical protein HPO96_04785 [Kribbella sandramycini]|uniref:Ricin B lectin domain-containing protein n=1 Tax=Kribbella sandramycini TaxID=60450 RepID=A0A7Y4KXM0_9ACTN|nr:ricin-type beta-trefoil lectin domain protein [Kribbella sandramycini]MBB6567849.1 hypothetical protein [Kribbella sandramycini]NOL39556.1 hypothetical protein [Kribbella sandramycini]